ncbi:putative phosphatidate phosphatase [Cydia amplana]|uniref:putative phosphatidate phosphatase n=1 Tax=Cydia amplana TaxID=1869771 RepID=UPI002FE59955
MSRDEPSICVLRKLVLDGFLIAGLTVCLFAMKLLWEPFSRGFFCDDESLKYPYHDNTVTTPMLRLFGLGLPFLVILVCEWIILRKEPSDTKVFGLSIPTWIRGLYCTVVAFGLGALFVELATEIAKHVIGRLRPHFFDLCRPSIDCSLAEWRGRYVLPSEYYCTGNSSQIDDMRKSFLSGHSSFAAYTMVFVALYLERRMTWRGTRVLRHSLQFSALMISWFTALSRVSDYKHHWSDVLAGYSLGVVFAILVVYCGIDLVQKKKNHIIVPQNDVYVIGPTHA